MITYLNTGQLGPFRAFCSRDDVLQALGPPQYWEGFKDWPFENSTIWLYDSVQFNFDARLRLADTHIGFESTFDGTSVKYLDRTDTFLQFYDLALDAISTPERFQNTMAASQIATTQYSFSGGHVMINTDAGVQARFSTVTDLKGSINCERRIATTEPYLHRVTTIVLAEPSGKREPPMTRVLKP